MNKWNYRFLKQAREVSSWSKDPSRKIGAIAVRDRRVLSVGYNGFPRGISDTSERLHDREVKYQYVVHAEMNCIYNATHGGVSLDGSDLYVYGLPVCAECAKGIIQVGIKTIHVMPSGEIPEIWIENWIRTSSMFQEAGLEWYSYDEDYVDEQLQLSV